ncbi:MAG: T9SS type A sorting domain-containing protein [Ginsengibacter sp.]
MKIYPNPVHNFLSIQLPAKNIFDITITDITGRQIFKGKKAGPQSQINCAGFPKGTYFLKAANNNKTFTEKFTKQ